ncbi:hypothetical protein HMPREF0658_1875 [Hoylesella marshii DSM 16973 = JCM 13450]|uniref:Uncharacterized protein n=1 Tax=Hoylesella marshii DSM 16973 = JCM 13450 TaxID=862515 RepID=E0NUM0_9BACT|nr:hypothetical protein HMPREF0658_1875 [Hoylesella marshii DSM 16973 = JCM 13450]
MTNGQTTCLLPFSARRTYVRHVSQEADITPEKTIVLIPFRKS